MAAQILYLEQSLLELFDASPQSVLQIKNAKTDANARKQLAVIERLHQVIIRPTLKTLHQTFLG